MTSPGLGGAKLGLGTVALGGGLDSPDRFKGIVIKVFSAARNTFPASHTVIILNGDHDEAHLAISADPDRADHRLVRVAPELLSQLA
jgi:hypothetical protein